MSLSESIAQHFPNQDKLGLAFVAEDHNGFGFQAHGAGPPGHIVFARVHDSTNDEFLHAMRQATNSNTVTIHDFLGCVFLSVHYLEWNLIPSLFQYAIDHGNQWIMPHIPSGKMRFSFTSGDRFSWALMEERCIDEFEQTAESLAHRAGANYPWSFAFDLIGKPHAWCKPWNWRTKKGRAFCADLRRALGKRALDTPSVIPPHFSWPGVDDACREFGVLHHSAWYGWDDLTNAHSTPLDNPNPESANSNHEASKSEESEDECMICFDRRPDTLVLPCQHTVVCRECSVRLRNSADATRCVRCRNIITSVLCDEV